ncbi:MAG: sigma-70 family RNA polymerase sigma factor [Candidatus Magasanikbacteria bacterium]|nr:sigma-70 family RNA polymerase sigma factor [Candidatus Magasanikbacteria bacterium]
MGEPPVGDLIALMIRAKQGDQAAWAEVYQRFFLPVYRYTRRRVLDRPAAEDITQTVFLKVYTSTTKFSDQAVSPLAYFFTVARSAIADYWQKNQHREVPVEESAAELSMETITQKVEEQLIVEQALRELADEPRRVLTLKFFDGYRTEEIARTLHKTPEAIRQIQCRALRQLRHQLLPSPARGEAVGVTEKYEQRSTI